MANGALRVSRPAGALLVLVAMDALYTTLSQQSANV
jgi:hypothetical protein